MNYHRNNPYTQYLDSEKETITARQIAEHIRHYSRNNPYTQYLDSEKETINRHCQSARQIVDNLRNLNIHGYRIQYDTNGIPNLANHGANKPIKWQKSNNGKMVATLGSTKKSNLVKLIKENGMIGVKFYDGCIVKFDTGGGIYYQEGEGGSKYRISPRTTLQLKNNIITLSHQRSTLSDESIAHGSSDFTCFQAPYKTPPKNLECSYYVWNRKYHNYNGPYLERDKNGNFNAGYRDRGEGIYVKPIRHAIMNAQSLLSQTRDLFDSLSLGVKLSSYDDPKSKKFSFTDRDLGEEFPDAGRLSHTSPVFKSNPSLFYIHLVDQEHHKYPFTNIASSHIFGLH